MVRLLGKRFTSLVSLDAKTIAMAKNDKGSDFWRTVLEVVSGMFAAVPMGVFLYFVIIVLWVWAIELLAFPVLLIPHVGSRIMGWLAFSHGVIPLIAAMAVTMELWFCRILIRRHHRVFAYTQALLGLAVASPFFYWTFVHQKPLLPFWGQ